MALSFLLCASSIGIIQCHVSNISNTNGYNTSNRPADSHGFNVSHKYFKFADIVIIKGPIYLTNIDLYNNVAVVISDFDNYNCDTIHIRTFNVKWSTNTRIVPQSFRIPAFEIKKEYLIKLSTNVENILFDDVECHFHKIHSHLLLLKRYGYSPSKPLRIYVKIIGGDAFRKFGLIGLRALIIKYREDNSIESDIVTRELHGIVRNYHYLRAINMGKSLHYNISINEGDLVKVKVLKKQNDTDLQRRAAFMNSYSFGVIMKQLSDTNKRNQTEIYVQSLFDENITLRLRPKYLERIGKIYIHNTSDFDVSMLSDLMNKLLADPSNKVMYLPSVRSFNFNAKVSALKTITLPTSSYEYNELSMNMASALFACGNTVLPMMQNLNTVQIIKFMTNLHFICDARIMNQTIKQMHELQGRDSKMRRDISKIQDVYQTNYMRMLNANNQSMDILQQQSTEYARVTLGHLLVCKTRRNIAFWKALLMEISEVYKVTTRISDAIRPQRVRRNKTPLECWKQLIISDILENYLLRTNNQQLNLHVITQNIEVSLLLIPNIAAQLHYVWNMSTSHLRLTATDIMRKLIHVIPYK